MAELERAGVPVRVITQNVDGLHQLAGMPERKVLELHGTARERGVHPLPRAVPDGGGARAGRGRVRTDPPCRECGGILKSATVMFGERLDPVVLGEAVAIAKACQVFIAVGTSLQVQPAAALAGIAADHGARLIIVNAEPTPYDDLADEVIREPIGTALPACCRSERSADGQGRDIGSAPRQAPGTARLREEARGSGGCGAARVRSPAAAACGPGRRRSR